METFREVLGTVNGFVWGLPTMFLLMGTGVLLTFWTGGVQFRRLGYTFRLVFGRIEKGQDAEGTVTSFQALATALASTVGVGNIAGVATAISLGPRVLRAETAAAAALAQWQSRFTLNSE